MLTKNQREIMNLYVKNIFLEATIRKLSLILKKAYPKIYEAVIELEKKNILSIKKIGNSSVCSLNLNRESITFLSFLDKEEAFSIDIPNVNRILDFKEFLDDILIVTGSYAKKEQTKKSDIDLILITRDDAHKKQGLMENMTLTFLPEIHVNAFSYKDFIEMLLNNEFNLGKEVFKYHLIFRNSERYYELIREAIKNGFKG